MKTRTTILISGGLFTALFLFMIGFLAHFVAVNEQDMVNNSYNSRQEILLSQNYRGSVYSRDGEVLAETVMDAAQNETRVYPFDNLFSHVVGYSTNGRMGVEAQANYYLINTNTSLSNKVANDMAGLKNPGDSVYTTLDVQIQQVADEQLSVYKGAVVVTEVSTGKVLAMVSHPDFDPNEIAEIWDSLLANDTSSVLVNRATQGLYPPGSTFKIVTALEYIGKIPIPLTIILFAVRGILSMETAESTVTTASVTEKLILSAPLQSPVIPHLPTSVWGWIRRLFLKLSISCCLIRNCL